MLIGGGALLAGRRRLDLLYAPFRASLVAAYRGEDYTAGSWPDRTGNGYDLSQATGSLQPAAVADGGADFNHRPIVRPDGAGDFLKSGTGLALAQPHTVLAITKATLANGANKYLFIGRTSGSTLVPIIFWNSSEILGIAVSAALLGASGNNVPLVTETYYDNTSSAIRANGAVEGSGTVNSTNGISNGITLFANSDGTLPWGGDLYELAIVDGALDSVGRAYVARYARQQLGIS